MKPIEFIHIGKACAELREICEDHYECEGCPLTRHDSNRCPYESLSEILKEKRLAMEKQQTLSWLTRE